MEPFFVGRVRELAAADALIEVAVRGEGAALWFEGPAGYGKSGLVRRVAGRARHRGLGVVHAPVVASQELPSLGPWQRLLTKVEALVPGVAGSPAALLSADWTQSEALAGANPAERRYALFEKVGRYLREVARAKSLCLVCEDLHAWDHLSQQLLEYLTDILEGAPLLFVLTLRPIPAGEGGLGNLGSWMGQSETRSRLVLSPLTRAELDQALADRPETADLSAADLYRWTAGIPYLLSLIVDLGMAGAAGADEGVDLGTRFWAGLQGRLGDEGREAVVRLALLGHRARAADLGWDEDRAQRTLADLGRQGLVREADTGEFHLFHEEFGAAVLHSLTPDDRDRSLERLVEAWERNRRDQDDAGLLVLKNLCLAGSPERFGDRARAYRLRVVEQHRARGAWPEVLAEVTALLEAGDRFDEQTLWHLKLLYCLGRTRSDSWLPGEKSMGTLVEVTRKASREGRWDDFLDLIQTPYFMLDPVPGIEEFLLDSLDRLGSGAPGSLTLQLILSEVRHRRRGRAAEARAFLDRAVADRGPRIPAAELYRAQVHQGFQSYFARDFEAGLRRADELLTHDRTALGREVYLPCLVLKAWTLFALGRMDECREVLGQVLPLRSLYQSDFWHHVAQSRLIRLDLLRGDWEPLFRQKSMGRNNFLLVVPQTVALCLQGRFDQADAVVEQFRSYLLGMNAVPGAPVSAALGWVMAVRTYLSGESRWVAAAEDLFDRFLGQTDRTAEQVQLAVAAGRITRWATDGRHRLAALAILDEALPSAFEEEDYTVHAARALVLEALGRQDEAPAAWEAALERCDVVGERPWRAHYQVELARTLGKTDPGRAARLAALAGQTAADLGLVPLVRRLEAPVPPTAPVPPRGPSVGLTARETEILRGLVAGMSDKEMAFHLGVSPFTVGNHLRSIYAKLGRNSRLEAAQWAVQAGLTALD